MGQTSIPCTTSVRDRLAEDKPNRVNWPEYLDALHKDAEFIIVNDDVNIGDMVAELVDTLGASDAEDIEQIKDALATVEQRTGNIERTLEDLQR